MVLNCSFVISSNYYYVFYSSLKGGDCALEIEEFVVILDNLSDNIFDKIEEQIPEEWQEPDLHVLRDYLSQARDNSQFFRRSLQEILV